MTQPNPIRTVVSQGVALVVARDAAGRTVYRAVTSSGRWHTSTRDAAADCYGGSP